MTLEEGDNIVRSARFATVRWANRCLEYNDIVGRWIDILALGGRTDERSDVVEEGKKGLVGFSLASIICSQILTYVYLRIPIGTDCSMLHLLRQLALFQIGMRWSKSSSLRKACLRTLAFLTA
jgi:hypothetical protein